MHWQRFQLCLKVEMPIATKKPPLLWSRRLFISPKDLQGGVN